MLLIVNPMVVPFKRESLSGFARLLMIGTMSTLLFFRKQFKVKLRFCTPAQVTVVSN